LGKIITAKSAPWRGSSASLSFRIRDGPDRERDRQRDELQARHENEDQNEGERRCLRFHEGENAKCVGEQQEDGKANAEGNSPAHSDDKKLWNKSAVTSLPSGGCC
jgi:hypothetical protein